MTNEEVQNIALRQSAIDCNCRPEDFLGTENKINCSAQNDKARKYLPLPFACDLVSYGTNIVAQTSEKLKDTVKEYLDHYAVEHCFETPNIYVLNEKVKAYDMRVCFMAEYFLPDTELLKPLLCAYEIRVLEAEELQDLYQASWSNALCEERKELDVLGVGAYEDGRLIGLAGCSADCETMWQIGVDVLPAYRKKGIASALTSRIAVETIARRKVPFYCCAWCNVKSARNAIRSGFKPAWVELTVRDNSFIDKMIE